MASRCTAIQEKRVKLQRAYLVSCLSCFVIVWRKESGLGEVGTTVWELNNGVLNILLVYYENGPGYVSSGWF